MFLVGVWGRVSTGRDVPQDVPGQTGTGHPVVPLSHDKKNSCPGVPLSWDKGRSKCPGTNSSVPGCPVRVEGRSIKNNKHDLGMAIPRRISFFEESRSRGIAIWHSSRIEEDEIYSSGSSRIFEDFIYELSKTLCLMRTDISWLY